jgi:cytochrome bd-type quinol oxidase subunit 1/mono/diheme cytochrome c family protein
LISHYAVGGGLFLAVETTYAYRTDNRAYLAYLKRHARFFVLLTVVMGAITGVGIWWTIGLASPLATQVLIRTFVFAWATEYVFFIVEIASAFIFYYYWGRLPAKTHTIIVWIYGLSAWASLVIISAITAYMLDPGASSNWIDTLWPTDRGYLWPQDHAFWKAIFNRQSLPQIISRTGGALLLSSLYVYLHAAITIKDPKLHALIEKRSTRPALLGALLITLGGLLWHAYLPDSAQAALLAAPVLNVLMAVLFAATGVVFLLLFFGPYRNPGLIRSPGFAACLFLFGITGFSTAEFIREAVRKPYIIYNVVLGNQILATVDEAKRLQDHGYLEGGVWTKAFVQANYPRTLVDGRIDRQLLLKLPRADRVALGGLIFQYHCNDCHAVAQGYSPVGPLVQGWTPEMIRALIRELDKHRFTMPPWSGTPEEAELLTTYLSSIAPLKPAGMAPGAERPAAAQGGEE